MRTMGSRVPVLLALTLSACVVQRDRPASDLLGPEGAAAARAMVRITHPVPDQVLYSTKFTSQPGVQLTYTGLFPAGHFIVVAAYVDEEVDRPFFTLEIPVGEEDPPRAVFVRGSESRLQGSRHVTIRLAIRDVEARSLIADSVRIRLN